MAQLQLESLEHNIILDMQLLALAPVGGLVDLNHFTANKLSPLLWDDRKSPGADEKVDGREAPGEDRRLWQRF